MTAAIWELRQSPDGKTTESSRPKYSPLNPLSSIAWDREDVTYKIDSPDRHKARSELYNNDITYIFQLKRRRLRSSTRVDKVKAYILENSHLLNDEDAASEFAWTSMQDFLINSILYSELLSIKLPYIANADDQSIDLYWKLSGVDLLINFPKDSSRMPTYYGSSLGGGDTGGHIDKNTSPNLFFEWLTGTNGYRSHTR